MVMPADGRPKGAVAQALAVVADLEHLGAIIRGHRQRRGLSQEDLGQLSRLSRTHVGDVERGEVGLSFATLEALAHGLGMPLAELVAEYEERRKEAGSRDAKAP